MLGAQKSTRAAGVDGGEVTLGALERTSRRCDGACVTTGGCWDYNFTALLRLSPRVNLHVSLKAATGGASKLANTAPVRLVSSVRAHVHLEVMVDIALEVALAALVGLLSSV